MDIDNELGLIFSSVLSEIITTVSGFSLNVLPPPGKTTDETQDEHENSFDEMTGIMSLSGKKNSILFISAKENDMSQLCSSIIGVPQNELTKEDVEDTLCELVNMTAGSAKLRLSGTEYVFNLSSPFILKGQNMHIVRKRKTRVISRDLGNGEITVRIKVVY
ncbi:MAG: chemotaxis protein CheX [Treponema sp.]|nr:chemotaxis protein CheX [Treponema sp.]